MYTRTCGTLKCPRDEQEKLQTAVSKDKSVAENGSPQTTVSPDKLVAGCSLPPLAADKDSLPLPSVDQESAPLIGSSSSDDNPVAGIQADNLSSPLMGPVTFSQWPLLFSIESPLVYYDFYHKYSD